MPVSAAFKASARFVSVGTCSCKCASLVATDSAPYFMKSYNHVFMILANIVDANVGITLWGMIHSHLANVIDRDLVSIRSSFC